MLPHTWDNGVVTDPGTCLAPGSMKYTCTACGETKAESITGNHDYKYAHDADDHYQECSVCGDKKNVEAHKWNEGVVTQEPNCLVSGIIEYTCTVCGAKDCNDLVGEHDYKDAHDADNHYQECSVCGDKKDIEAHKLVWKIDREATTSKEGEKHEECSVCGYKKAPVRIAKLSPSEKPKTGDSSFVWAAILLVSGCALPAMLYIKRRRA